jgi:hypothetical protein
MNAYRVLVGNTEGKIRLGRCRNRCKDNIKINLRKTGLGVIDWIHLAQDRDRWRDHVDMIMNRRVI